MRKFDYKPPRIHSGELRTRVTFFEFAPNQGPEPGEEEKRILFQCMAKIDGVWLKDMELAKSTGTLSDLTITIRDPQGEYIPTNKHYISIDDPEYQDKHYNVVHVQHDLQNRIFITIVGRLVE